MADVLTKIKSALGITGNYQDTTLNIYIDEVLHKTYISVGEKGTRAAAATNVIADDFFYDMDIKQPMFLIAMSDLAYGLIQYFFLFLLRGKLEFGFYFANIIIPEFLYTVVLILFFYRGILRLYEKLDKLDVAGSVDEFV